MVPKPGSTSSNSRSTSPDENQTSLSSTCANSIKKPKPRRTRASNAKVKTGCLTCKRRHKKCDEARPSCMTCLTKGYKCDGYAVTGSKKPIDSTHLAAQQAQQSAWPARYSEPAFLPDINPREQRYFDIFCKYTIPQLAGGFESTFWQTFIPRASYQIPCVRHAAIALAALHEDFTQDRTVAPKSYPSPNSDSDFTMNQYGRALQSLLHFVRQSGDSATEVVLSVCVLFICFEIIRGNHNAVLLHTQSGMNLLTDAITKTSQQRRKRLSPVPLSAIAPVFTRIDVQASDIMDSAPFESYANFTKPLEPVPIPLIFESLEHSKQCLLEHQNYFMYKIRDVVRHYGLLYEQWPLNEQSRLFKMREQYITVQDRWYAAHDALTRRDSAKRNANAHRASGVLLVHYLLLRIALYRFPGQDEMDFDRYTSLFEKIVAASRNVLQYPLHKDSCENLTLSFDLGIAEPLFYVVTRCRVPRIRCEALGLLRQCPSNEGIWNSSLAARIGEEIIDIEQRGSPRWPHIESEKDIPRGARMRRGEPKYIKETGEMTITFTDLYGNRCERKAHWAGPESDMLIASQAKPDWAMGKYQRSARTRLRLKINTVPRNGRLHSNAEPIRTNSNNNSPLNERNSYTDMTQPLNVYDAAVPLGTEADSHAGLPALQTLGSCHEYPAVSSVEGGPSSDRDIFVGWGQCM